MPYVTWRTKARRRPLGGYPKVQIMYNKSNLAILAFGPSLCWTWSEPHSLAYPHHINDFYLQTLSLQYGRPAFPHCVTIIHNLVSFNTFVSLMHEIMSSSRSCSMAESPSVPQAQYLGLTDHQHKENKSALHNFPSGKKYESNILT